MCRPFDLIDIKGIEPYVEVSTQPIEFFTEYLENIVLQIEGLYFKRSDPIVNIRNQQTNHFYWAHKFCHSSPFRDRKYIHTLRRLQWEKKKQEVVENGWIVQTLVL